MAVQSISNQTPSVRLFTTKVWTRVHIRVLDGNTLYVSTDGSALNVPASGGIQQGLPISKADGLVSLVWLGDFWVLGSANPTLVDIEHFIAPGAGAGA